MNFLRKYKNIIWDWNGTLLDDRVLCLHILNNILLSQNSKPIKLKEYLEVFEFPIIKYYKNAGVDIQNNSFEKIAEEFMIQYYGSVYNCSLYNGTESILNRINFLNKRQFILTAGEKKEVLNLTKHYNIKHLFNDVCGLTNNFAEDKSLVGLKLVESYNMDKNKTVLIGDTLHDLEVSKKLNIDCILITNGHQSKKKLIRTVDSSVVILDTITELISTT